jgi:ribosomal-protein-alanine acetyltransferase
LPVPAESQFARPLPVEVRHCHPEDFPAIQVILQEAPEAANWTLQSLEETLQRDLKYFFIATTGSGLVGFIVGRQIKPDAELLNLAVAPAARRSGVATGLLQALLEALRRDGMTQVFLEVRESNYAAITFYGKSGFQETGRRPNYYQNPDEAALVLAKRLS